MQFRSIACAEALLLTLISIENVCHYSASAFVPSPAKVTPSLARRSPHRQQQQLPFQRSHLSRRHLVPLESSSLLNAVEYFDGTQIVDPVVVSGTFWASLQTRLLSFFIGQALAAITFFIITAVASQQIGKLGDWVSNNIASKNQRLKVPPPLSNTAALVQPDLSKLLVCIVIDLIGTSSELIPILGEVTDVAWAPIAALILRSLYGSNVVLALEFAEEILPFTDILPLATICWFVDTYQPESNLAKLLQLGRYSPVVNGSDKADVIDVDGRSAADQVSSLARDKDSGR